MYYGWSWWWLISWLIPLGILFWIIFGSNGRRYGSGYGYGWRDDWWDRDERRRRGLAAGRHRGRGPRNYRRADARIYEDICDRLMLEDDLDASDIEVRVDNGAVTLTGTVTTRLDRRIAETIVDSAPGVTDVDNRLRVGQAGAAAQPQATQPLPGGST